MWERYKRELAEQERNTEDFLAKFYRTHNPDFRRLKSLGRQLGETEAGLGETETDVGQEEVLTLHHSQTLRNTLFLCAQFWTLMHRIILM